MLDTHYYMYTMYSVFNVPAGADSATDSNPRIGTNNTNTLIRRFAYIRRFTSLPFAIP